MIGDKVDTVAQAATSTNPSTRNTSRAPKKPEQKTGNAARKLWRGPNSLIYVRDIG